MEKAAANVPEPVTSAAVLAGLWSIRNDTLDGLAQPLTFVKDKPAKPTSCFFAMTIQGRRWVSPDGYKLHCR